MNLKHRVEFPASGFSWRMQDRIVVSTTMELWIAFTELMIHPTVHLFLVNVIKFWRKALSKSLTDSQYACCSDQSCPILGSNCSTLEGREEIPHLRPGASSITIMSILIRLISDDLAHLWLSGGWWRCQWHGFRGRAHPPQQGPHRRHGGQVSKSKSNKKWHFPFLTDAPSPGDTGWMRMSLFDFTSQLVIMGSTPGHSRIIRWKTFFEGNLGRNLVIFVSQC